MGPLPTALMMGWLLTAIAGTLPARADNSPAAGACASSPSACKDSAPYQNALPTSSLPQESARRQADKASGFFRVWRRMADHTEATQPDWLSPIATSSGRLKQEFRFDVWRQTAPSHGTDYTLGGSKGLELVVAPRLQVMVGLPTYSINGPREGLGDLPVMLKFRLASAPHREGDYLVTLLLGATVPTGSRAFGMRYAVLSPAVAMGKGWRRFDVQSTLGANLPTGDTSRLGRQLVSNTAFQYRASWKLWPELEVNSTSFLTGKNSGETQTFLTPGLGYGRWHIRGQLRFSAGAGYQISVTKFHTYNHRWIYSVRFPF